MKSRHWIGMIAAIASLGVGSGACSKSSVDLGANTPPAPGYNYFLYVVNSNLNQLHGHPIDVANGTVGTAAPSVTTANNLAMVAPDPKGRFVFAAISNVGIGAYKITSPSTGELAAAGSTFSSVNPTWVAVHPNGSYLYFTDFTNNTVVSLLISPSTGALSANGSPVATGAASHPNGVVVSPNGKFAFATTLSGTVQAFGINPSNGQLTAVGTSPSGLSVPEFPAVSPDGAFLYVVDTGSTPSAISVFSIGATGALTAASTKTSPAGSNFMGIAIDSLGRYLYAADQLQGGLVAYSIDSNSGALTQVGSEVLVGFLNPYSVSIAPNDLLIVVGANNTTAHSKAGVYTIDPGTGALTATAGSPYDVCFTIAHGAIAAVPQ